MQNHKNRQICKIFFYISVFGDLSMIQLNILFILSTKLIDFYSCHDWCSLACVILGKWAPSSALLVSGAGVSMVTVYDPALVNMSVEKHRLSKNDMAEPQHARLQVIWCCGDPTASPACHSQKKGCCIITSWLVELLIHMIYFTITKSKRILMQKRKYFARTMRIVFIWVGLAKKHFNT